MKLKTWLAALTAAGTLGIFAMPTQAAPIGGRDVLKGAAAQPSDVQQAHWYGRRHGYRPRYGYRDYGYRGYGYRGYGYRPGFRFYYGPRYHRRHYRSW